eukprot:m.62704 g.62704  ORF g.62704 m.62704 type:complete len:96 (+) comp8040_c2_seq1:30-317(+)
MLLFFSQVSAFFQKYFTILLFIIFIYFIIKCLFVEQQVFDRLLSLLSLLSFFTNQPTHQPTKSFLSSFLPSFLPFFFFVFSFHSYFLDINVDIST